MVPAEQLVTQAEPCKLKFLQEMQLVTVFEQVSQSPAHATATPDILMYPKGIVVLHLPKCNTYGASQAIQLVAEEQLKQFCPEVAQE
jgi:hypothetical protein